MKCQYCGRKFVTGYINQKYCSRECYYADRRIKAYKTKKETICWTCKNTNDSCPWFRPDNMPVNGWKATPVYKGRGKDKKLASYIVHECPNYDFYRV